MRRSAGERAYRKHGSSTFFKGPFVLLSLYINITTHTYSIAYPAKYPSHTQSTRIRTKTGTIGTRTRYQVAAGWLGCAGVGARCEELVFKWLQHQSEGRGTHRFFPVMCSRVSVLWVWRGLERMLYLGFCFEDLYATLFTLLVMLSFNTSLLVYTKFLDDAVYIIVPV